MPFSELEVSTFMGDNTCGITIPHKAITVILNRKGKAIFTGITDLSDAHNPINHNIATICVNSEYGLDTDAINFYKHHVVSVLGDDMFIGELYYPENESYINNWPSTREAKNIDVSTALEVIAIKRTELLLGVE